MGHLISRIISWIKGIGICTDCGKREKVETLCHEYAAYHDIFIKKIEPKCRFIGSYEKQLCDKCWDKFNDAWTMFELTRFKKRSNGNLI